jgi:hypothetical protein
MKTLFFILLALNLALGAWLWLGGPVDEVREPTRVGLQVVPEQFRPLTDADLSRMRSQAEKAAAATANTQAQTPAPAPVAPLDLPQTDCLLIVNFSSEAAARKLRTRLSESGVGGLIAVETQNQKNRLRVTGSNAATEDRIQQALKEFPKLALEHCIGAPVTH